MPVNRRGDFEAKMEEPGQQPLKKKKKTTGGRQKDGVSEQDNGEKPQVAGENVNSSGAEANTSEKTDVRFDRFKLFEKIMQKSLQKYVEIARYVYFISCVCPCHGVNGCQLFTMS